MTISLTFLLTLRMTKTVNLLGMSWKLEKLHKGSQENEKKN